MVLGRNRSSTWRHWSREPRDALGGQDEDELNDALGCRDRVSLGMDLSKIYFSHWEPLGVSESCRTRIPGWSNPRVYWTDGVDSRRTWEHLGAPATCLGVPMTTLGAPGTACNKPGSASHKPGSTSNHSWAVWEKQHLLREHCCCAWKS